MMIRAARTPLTLAGALSIGLTGTISSAAAEGDFDWLYSSKLHIAGTQKDGNRLLADCRKGGGPRHLQDRQEQSGAGARKEEARLPHVCHR